jgi:septal ring factor EnvC (AmiA/AmiB activator)
MASDPPRNEARDGAQLAVIEADGHAAVAEERNRLQEELATLQRRYAKERSANQALLTTVKELEARQAARLRRLRLVEGQLRMATARNEELTAALEETGRPLGRRLFRRQ